MIAPGEVLDVQSRAGAALYLGEQLGQFVATTPWELLDQPLRHEARRCVLNHLGCSLAARNAHEVEHVLAVLGRFGAQGGLTVVGRSETADASTAAFMNAMTANFFDFDDTHASTVIHPTAPVLAAALAVGEMIGASGSALLHAFILGVEVECRIGKAVSPAHYARGWHITSTAGVFGAAAAVARLLGLDARRTWMALGIASSQSAGNIENLTYFPKNVSVGNAARNGLFSAFLAQGGSEAAPAAIEGRFGWARTMGDELRVDGAIAGLGKTWELFDNTYKPYPTGVVFHSAIDATLLLRERVKAPGVVAEIVLSGHQLLSDRGDRVVHTPGDARVSAQHCIAATLVRGRCTLAEFDEAAVADPAIVALRGNIRVEVDAQPLGAATLHVTLADGERFEIRQATACGSLDKPMSDSDLETKFRQNCRFGGWKPGDLVAQIAGLEEMADISTLLHSCRAVT